MLMFKKGIIFAFSLLALSTLANTASVPSHELSLVNPSAFLNPVEPNKTIHFTVWLKFRNKHQLTQLINEIYDENSPRYQSFLTHDEFEQQYAPTPEIENAVQKFFMNQGMRAILVHHTIQVTASARQVEQALNVKMNYYRYQNKKVYINQTTPILPPDIAPFVLDISGLSNIELFNPFIMKIPDEMKPIKSMKSQELNMQWESFVPLAHPTTTSIGGFTGAQLKIAYKLANVAPVQGKAINGNGQTIIIVNGCGMDTAAQITSDANTYNSANGLPPFTAANFAILTEDLTPFTTCSVSGATGWEDEIALDIQAAHTIAPGANIVLVLGNNFGTALSNIVNTLSSNHYTIAGFPNAYVISNSWGAPESEFFYMEPLLQQAASLGINFNFSTGDCGDGTYSSGACFAVGTKPSVFYPASSLYVTALGGTSAFVDSNWNYAMETGWGTYFNGFYFGAGGGISQFFGPATWQASISSFTAGGYGVISSFNKRALPDISMLGDPVTGLKIFRAGNFIAFGGTSLASPLFAGTLALVNQARLLKNKGPIGLAAPYFYTQTIHFLRAEAFNPIIPPHRIISGANTPPSGAALSSFSVFGVTYGWNSSLTIAPENQFWSDAVGVGSPSIPSFVQVMSTL